DQLLRAYNPNGNNYTLFVPDNKAVETFIKESGQFASLDALLKDKAYSEALARYHIINIGTSSNEFPFGAFSEPNLSDDYLSVNFIFEKDTTYYKINNQAPVSKANIEVSNGYIHVIDVMLKPITLNSYNWLKMNSGYSILTAAIEATGLSQVLDVDMKSEDQTLSPFTMLVEPDSIYNKRNIHSFEDLASAISPGRTDYTNSSNPLKLFVQYHILTESEFLDDLQGKVTNYNTFADIPLTINGLGIDILINKGKEIFEPIIANGDTTIIDFVGIDYDASNVITQSGSIHFVNQVLKPQIPSRAIVDFQFNEEPVLAEYRRNAGSYLIGNAELLKYITWKGADLFFVKSVDAAERSSNKDYLQIDGDFTITYQLPKIVQGNYNVILVADAFNSMNALVELSIDGNKLGGVIDLTKGGNAGNPYLGLKVGSVDFIKYEGHTVQIKSLIPGRLRWDYIRFEPF
ncbi:MAG TPA: fasciclin domain-containing protein, partial [Prolixibacteraceae bacterium]|nr:fasciclin domain-containing protein [Prolixibacteraceae bacterium]